MNDAAIIGVKWNDAAIIGVKWNDAATIGVKWNDDLQASLPQSGSSFVINFAFNLIHSRQDMREFSLHSNISLHTGNMHIKFFLSSSVKSV